MTLSPAHPLVGGQAAQSPLIRAMRGDRPERTPVWFMRQAGRSLPEYRAAREGIPMLRSCTMPELVAELTLQPVRRHGVDAAILFSDIVMPLSLAGLGVEIRPGVGPVIDAPVRTRRDLDRLRGIDQESLAPIVRAVELSIAELGDTPLIGFGGAPFTVASYLIEGGPSLRMPHVRAMMRDDPELWGAVLAWCADVTAAFVSAQVRAGASALQVFDSWAGRLTLVEYVTYAQPYTARLFDALSSLVDADGVPVPRVHFGVGTGPVLRQMLAAGATVMGVDAITDLRRASEVLGPAVPLQGNISPDVLGAEWPEVAAHVRAVLEAGRAAPAHIVNLGHGVPKDTDPEVLTRIVALVHGEDA